MNFARIEKALQEEGALLSHWVDDRTQCHVWSLTFEYAHKMYDLFPNRVLSIDFLNKLTKSQLKLLLDVMMLGDGCRSQGKVTFCCRDEPRRDMFQTLCTLNGIATRSWWKDQSDYRPVSPKLKNIPKCNGAWIVRLLERDKVQVVKSQRYEFVDKRPVWCPSVPNTYFVARRNGCVYITGNCPFQGLAADGAKLALWNLWKAGFQVTAFIHDEVVVELPEAAAEEDAKAVDRIMIDSMSEVLEGFPVEVEGHLGTCWTK